MKLKIELAARIFLGQTSQYMTASHPMMEQNHRVADPLVGLQANK